MNTDIATLITIDKSIFSILSFQKMNILIIKYIIAETKRALQAENTTFLTEIIITEFNLINSIIKFRTPDNETDSASPFRPNDFINSADRIKLKKMAISPAFRGVLISEDE